ncbi:helix-turn-helix domain-containing protein [Streptomyces sp. NPDC050610]|uniref:helix-turn-helix domain-containing protein n=1 Tax=Streptomyces sp. NPDC050610 TaxID=3157097 RepID=UPI003447B526
MTAEESVAPDEDQTLPSIPPRKRLRGTATEEFDQAAAADYTDRKASIRNIAARTGRSFGAIHRSLTRQKVTFRPRGGAHRSATKGEVQ